MSTLSMATPAAGQTGRAETPPAQSRLLVLTPTIALTEAGWDNNIFRVNNEDKRVGDFTATLSPAVRASVRMGRLNVTGRSRFDFVYFRDTSSINSIDRDNGVRAQWQLGRLQPYAGGDWLNARHRRNLEIDLPVRRVDESWYAGVDMRLSGKTSIGVLTQRLRSDYTGDTIYQDVDLAEFLAVRGTQNGVTLSYALTPLTTIGVAAERDRSEFDVVGARNSKGFRVMSVVEFRPRAAISGSARVGIRRRTFVDGSAPPFEGTVARADLAYTMLGRTRFTVSGQRDLSYSYRPAERDYLLTGVEVSVTQRVGSRWDVGGAFGRFILDYGVAFGRPGVGATEERVHLQGINVGHYIDRVRVGLQFSRQTRTSDFELDRGFEAIRAMSSISFAF